MEEMSRWEEEEEKYCTRFGVGGWLISSSAVCSRQRTLPLAISDRCKSPCPTSKAQLLIWDIPKLCLPIEQKWYNVFVSHNWEAFYNFCWYVISKYYIILLMIHHWIYINQTFMTWMHINYKALCNHLALYNTTEKIEYLCFPVKISKKEKNT